MTPLTKKLFFNTVPIIISSAVFQLQLIVSNYVIGFFGEGYISILSNTNQIVGIFQILFVSNIITIIYPRLAREVQQNLSDSINNISTYITYTNVLIILLCWGYLALGQDLIDIMFVRGNFTVRDGQLVFYFGISLIFSLPISVVRDYLYRFLYSLDNVTDPAKNSIQTVIINIFLIIILQFFIGPYSVVISPFIGTIVSTIGITIKIFKHGYFFNLKEIISNFIIFNIFGLIMFILLRVINIPIQSKIFSFCVLGITGLAIYSICTILYFIIMNKIKVKFS